MMKKVLDVIEFIKYAMMITGIVINSHSFLSSFLRSVISFSIKRRPNIKFE